MDDRGHRRDRGFSRRELIKRTLKTGAYAAPVILSATIPMVSVSAVTPLAGTAIQDAVIFGVGHNATFDVLFALNTGPTGLLGQIVSDNFGVAGGVFAFPPGTNLHGVTTVTLTYFLNVGGVRSALPAAPPFTSGLVGLMNGQASLLLANILQIPLGCPTPAQYSEYVDAAIVNGSPNTAYRIMVQINGTGTPVQAGVITTSAQGHGTGYFPASATSASATAPTSVVVTAVPVSTGNTFPPLTVNAGAGTLRTLTCLDVASTSGASIGLAPA
jgi:hypothetical protein